MRPALCLLLVAVPVLAGEPPEVDPFVTRVQVFRKAVERVLEPGGQGVVNPAVDALVETGDVRAIGELAPLLVETFAMERDLEAASRERQRRGLEAHERTKVLDRELHLLRLKERAGDDSVGPEIQKREDEQRVLLERFDTMRGEVEQLGRTLHYVHELRDRLTSGCARVLAGAGPGDAKRGLGMLRETLDVADREQALYLVRILRNSGQPAAEDHLLAVIAHPGTDPAVLRAAVYGLAPVLSERGARVLLELWKSDEDAMGPRVRHVLGLAAHRTFASRDEAVAWVDSLGG